MNNLFKKPTAQELAKQQQRQLRTVERDLQRDNRQLQQQERQLEQAIRKAAQKGDEAQAKQLAKQLIQLRKHLGKSQQVQTQVSGIKMQTQTIASTAAMTKAMGQSSQIMAAGNQAISLPKLQKSMQQFQHESALLEMKEDLMNDTLEDVLGDSEDEQEGEMIMNQILDEIGLEIQTKAAGVPMAKPETTPVEESSAIGSPNADFLRDRLSKLKG